MDFALLSLPAPCPADRAFYAVAGRPYPAFLDSALPGPLGRRSFVATDPFLVVHAKGRSADLRWFRQGRSESWRGNPFELLRGLLREFRRPAGPFPLAPGGAIGYLAYDLFPQVEAIRPTAVDDLGMPDLFFGFYDAVAVFDPVTGEAHLALSGAPGDREAARDRWAELLRAEAPPPPAPAPLDPGALTSNFTREAYCRAILRAKEYIAAGDIYQANLSQRFTAPFAGDPVGFYRSLRTTSPAPFGACLFPDGFAVLSNSPERYLLVDGDYIETRPIKGTVPRGRTAEEDRELARRLRASEKDRAEHVMIVDLERNDLGRVCAYRSVHVPEFLVIESYANVHHLVSTVAGRVHPSRDVVDCIRNSFPGGSITGAPKVRAMEIIDELEPTARGVYCGSIGYIDFSGRVDLNIAIRTAVVRGDRIHFQVGGGIVADSDPEAEYEETVTKAQSFLKVLTGAGRVWEGG
ncbi:MAG: aminodeoxychorismate synthase component I [Candidatus Dadabacteria bacterium]|nr:MAG: aminodeoxychorismate synthase component I [Candidatus Dadabacteria bacterium]